MSKVYSTDSSQFCFKKLAKKGGTCMHMQPWQYVTRIPMYRFAPCRAILFSSIYHINRREAI